MEHLVETVTRGNVAEVKAVLATVGVGVGVWQIALMAIGYGKLRPRALEPGPASRAHRAIGDTLLVVTVTAATMCAGYFGLEEAFEGGSEGLHALAAIVLLGVLALKVGIIRGDGRGGALLPYLGSSVFILLVVVWVTSVPGVIGAD